jgi:hypothetical protein
MNQREKMLKNKQCFVVVEGDDWCVLCNYNKQKIVEKYTYLEY